MVVTKIKVSHVRQSPKPTCISRLYTSLVVVSLLPSILLDILEFFVPLTLWVSTQLLLHYPNPLLQGGGGEICRDRCILG